MGDDTKTRELRDAKLKLYCLLLEKSPDDYSEQEIEMAYNLSKDPQMVAVRNEVFAKNRAAEAEALAAKKEAPTNETKDAPVQTDIPA